MTDSFTADKLAWLDQVADDPNVTDGAFRVAHALSRHFNRSSGDAWPSQATLAARVRLSRRGLQYALTLLSRKGHLDVKIGKGRGACNSYRPIKKANGVAHQEAEKSEARCAPNEEKGEAHCAGGAQPVAQGVRSPLRTEHIEENTMTEHTEGYLFPSDENSTADRLEAEFSEFWSAYPRKVAKGAARRAWKAARKKADLQTIIDGCQRYASERSTEDPKFTKHPATWLNSEAWDDEPAPRSSNGHGGPTHGRPMSALEYAMRNIDVRKG